MSDESSTEPRFQQDANDECPATERAPRSAPALAKGVALSVLVFDDEEDERT